MAPWDEMDGTALTWSGMGTREMRLINNDVRHWLHLGTKPRETWAPGPWTGARDAPFGTCPEERISTTGA